MAILSNLAETLKPVHDSPTMFFPYRSITLRILVNAALIWLGLRFFAMIGGWGLRTSLPLALSLVFLTTGLAVFDVRRRAHHQLIENLGVSWLAVSVLAALPPGVFESIWLLVGSS